MENAFNLVASLPFLVYDVPRPIHGIIEGFFFLVIENSVGIVYHRRHVADYVRNLPKLGGRQLRQTPSVYKPRQFGYVVSDIGIDKGSCI